MACLALTSPRPWVGVTKLLLATSTDTILGADMLDHLPNTLSAELDRLGVKTTGNNNTAVGHEAEKIKRDYTFKKPNLDEHGEPDF